MTQTATQKPNAARPRARRTTRKAEEQIPVICRSAPKGNADLQGLHGILTIDRDRAKRVTEVTFDPNDQNVPNAIIPVVSAMSSEATMTVRAPEGRWSFAFETSSDEDEDEDEGEEIADAIGDFDDGLNEE
jgi:hypothetical protein